MCSEITPILQTFSKKLAAGNRQSKISRSRLAFKTRIRKISVIFSSVTSSIAIFIYREGFSLIILKMGCDNATKDFKANVDSFEGFDPIPANWVSNALHRLDGLQSGNGAAL